MGGGGRSWRLGKMSPRWQVVYRGSLRQLIGIVRARGVARARKRLSHVGRSLLRPLVQIVDLWGDVVF